MRYSRPYRATSLLIVVGMLLQLSPFGWSQPLFGHAGVEAAGTLVEDIEQTSLADCYGLYLPNILSGSSGSRSFSSGNGGQVSSQSFGLPSFEIITPAPGSTVSGVSSFAIQPAIGSGIISTSFSAGSVELGTDDTYRDGFRAFIDTSELTDGEVTLTATATNLCGSASESITVNVVANPPTSATVGTEGGTLASEIGSIITIPAGALPDGTDVSVDEKTQQEITDDNGFEWDDMGVTFLGAQAVTITQPLDGPLSMVASAGFSNRVQPGQAVVNYRISPDADGDGVDELVVVNTASVAPNDYVVSDPIEQIDVRVATSEAGGTFRIGEAPAAVSGVPGSSVTFTASGFNPYSPYGNLAVFESLVDSTVMTLTAMITQDPSDPSLQQVSTIIPLLPAGPAEVTLVNLSTGSSFGPLDVTVLPPVGGGAGSNPGDATLEFLDALDDAAEATIDNLQDGIDSGNPVDGAEGLIEDIQNYQESVDTFRDYIEGLRDSGDPGAVDTLNSFDSLAEGSGFADGLSGTDFAAAALGDLFSTLATGYGLLGDFLTIAGLLGFAVPPIGAALTIGAVAFTVFASILNGESLACAVASAIVAAIPLSTIAGLLLTGMGSVSPSGGAGCGALAPFGFGDLRSAQQDANIDYTVVKVFTSGSPRPFTAVVDPGGYFYLPLIPEGEPFIALAFDTARGETRSYTGVGPAVGESIFFTFDFNREEELIGTELMFGDEISGTLEPDDEPIIYTIKAKAGDRGYFDLLESNLNGARWSLTDPTGIQRFGTLLSDDGGVVDFNIGGNYLLTLTSDDIDTVSYRFKVWDIPDSDRFGISVGDIISSTNPGMGSGHIESPAARDIYTFTASSGQSLFFDGPDGFNPLRWSLLNPNGDEIFEDYISDDQGPLVITATATYTLLVGRDTDDIGTYGFQIWDVPDPDVFAISVGDSVSQNVPGQGAGQIETPAVRDIYTFSATAGQSLFFDGPDGFDPIRWSLTDVDGTELFEDYISDDQGPITMPSTGTYTLTVGRDSDDTTIYGFTVWDVPAADEFAINIGDTISNGVPGAGAGNIETPAVRDIYTFSATAGQSLFFDGPDGFDPIRWSLTDADGTELFEDYISDDQGPITMPSTGTYTLTIGRDSDDTTIYGFTVWDVPAADEFAINIGDTISNGVPGAGAGNIETPGVRDIYTFGGHSRSEFAL